MRTLPICALALTLAGCSHEPPPLTPSCFGMNTLACLTAVRVPIESEPTKKVEAASERTTASRLNQPRRSHAHRVTRRTKNEKPTHVATKAAAAVTAGQAQPSLQTTGMASEATRPTTTDRQPTTIAAKTRTIQEQVAAATTLAERMSTPVGSTDALVAVLMVPPDVMSVSELTGKTIAIDDRYSASNRSVKSAVAAAGALGVELSEGKISAINRLANKEVAAAVVALVTAGAADSFPDLAGYKVFQVPLSPRALIK